MECACEEKWMNGENKEEMKRRGGRHTHNNQVDKKRRRRWWGWVSGLVSWER